MTHEIVRLIVRIIEPRFFGYLILAISFTIGILSYSYIVLDGGGSFQSGDWLINYAGGFVRRGLFGQILITVGPNGNSLLWALFAIQSLFYGFLVLFFATLIHQLNSSWLITALICSPAGVAFYGWDPYAFGRKEVFLYLSLILLSLSFNHREDNRRLSIFLLLVGVFFYIFGIFCWEPVFLGFVGVIYFVRKIICTTVQSSLVRRIIVITISGLALFSFLLNALNSGSAAKVQEICLSLKQNGLNETKLCDGAIGALGWSLEYTLQLVRDSYPLYLRYIPLIALSMGLIFLLKLNLEMKLILSLNALSFIPLFVVVNDYGRWISIIYITNLIILLTSEVNLASRFSAKNPSQMRVRVLLAIIYMTTWGIPHYADPNYGFPTVSAIASSLKFLQHFLDLFSP